MLRIKPYFRVITSSTSLELMSETSYHQLSADYASIVERLQSEAGLDPSTISSMQEFEQLRELTRLDAIMDNKMDNIDTLLDFAGFPAAY